MVSNDEPGGEGRTRTCIAAPFAVACARRPVGGRHSPADRRPAASPEESNLRGPHTAVVPPRQNECVVAGFLLRYARRHARLPFWVLRPVRPRSSRLSFICQRAHEAPNERRARLFRHPAGASRRRPVPTLHRKWPPRRGSNPHATGLGKAPSRLHTPSLTERNGIPRQRVWRQVNLLSARGEHHIRPRTQTPAAPAYFRRPASRRHPLGVRISCARLLPSPGSSTSHGYSTVRMSSVLHHGAIWPGRPSHGKATPTIKRRIKDMKGACGGDARLRRRRA